MVEEYLSDSSCWHGYSCIHYFGSWSGLSFGYGQMVRFCHAFVFDLIWRGWPGAILMNE